MCEIIEDGIFNSGIYHYPNFKLCGCEWVEDVEPVNDYN